MKGELEVWFFNNRVGTLSTNRGRLNFRYAEDYLESDDAVPLSYSLPLRPESFGGREAGPFFAGVLPEGKVRRLIARLLGISAENDFALLSAIGGECAGAVTFLKPGWGPPSLDTDQDVRWLADEEVVELLDEMPRRPMLVDRDDMRLSLAGAQNKLPVVALDDRIGLPLRGAPSSHILKPAIEGFEGSVANEGFCLALAEDLNLQPARAHIRQVQNHAFLLVERYDRINENGRLQRLHQEDFCQALGVMPEFKYQNEGGPNLAQCFDLVRRVTRPSAPQILRLLDYVAFNALIGNHDAHAKNFSLLRRGDETVVAPLYDALATAVYPELTPKMAMKIGGKYKFEDIRARHWQRFAQDVGLSPAQTRRRILDMARQLPEAARELAGDHDFTGHPLARRIVGLIEDRADRTIRMLGEAV